MTTNIFSAAVTKAIEDTTEAAINATSGMSSKYSVICEAVKLAVEAKADTTVHNILVSGQDKCTTGPAYNVWIMGVKKGLQPLDLVLTGTRNKRSGKGAFTVETKAAVKAAKDEAATEAETLAKTAAAEAAAAKAEAESALSPSDVADGMLAELDRLGLSRADTLFALMATMQGEAKLNPGTADNARIIDYFNRQDDAHDAAARLPMVEAELKAAKAAQPKKRDVRKAA